MIFPIHRLLLLFIGRKRSVHFQKTFRQVHLHPLGFHIHCLEIGLGKWNLKQPSRLPDNQQGRFAGAKLNILNSSDLAVAIEDCTTDQIANVIPPGLQLRTLTLRNLQFASD